MQAKINNMENSKRSVLGEVVPLDTPYVVVVEPSGFCNLKCVFCPLNSPDYSSNLKRDFLDMNLYKKFLEQMKKFPEPVKILRLIGNGEPLLHKDICSIVSMAKEAGIAEKIEITTNGTLLKPSLSHSLIAAGLDVLKISVEALTEETFLMIAGKKIDIVKFRENIKYFHSIRKKCRVYIKTTNLAVPSQDDRDKFFKTFGDIADHIFVENVSPVWPEFSIKTDFSRNIDRYGRDIKRRNVCAHIFKSIMVCADGTILPCCADWQRKLALGTIYDESIIDVWQGEKLRKLQKIFLKHKRNTLDPCNECLYNEYCDPDLLDGYESSILGRMK